MSTFENYKKSCHYCANTGRKEPTRDHLIRCPILDDKGKFHGICKRCLHWDHLSEGEQAEIADPGQRILKNPCELCIRSQNRKRCRRSHKPRVDFQWTRAELDKIRRIQEEYGKPFSLEIWARFQTELDENASGQEIYREAYQLYNGKYPPKGFPPGKSRSQPDTPCRPREQESDSEESMNDDFDDEEDSDDNIDMDRNYQQRIATVDDEEAELDLPGDSNQQVITPSRSSRRIRDQAMQGVRTFDAKRKRTEDDEEDETLRKRPRTDSDSEDSSTGGDQHDFMDEKDSGDEEEPEERVPSLQVPRQQLQQQQQQPQPKPQPQWVSTAGKIKSTPAKAPQTPATAVSDDDFGKKLNDLENGTNTVILKPAAFDWVCSALASDDNRVQEKLKLRITDLSMKSESARQKSKFVILVCKLGDRICFCIMDRRTENNVVVAPFSLAWDEKAKIERCIAAIRSHRNLPFNENAQMEYLDRALAAFDAFDSRVVTAYFLELILCEPDLFESQGLNAAKILQFFDATDKASAIAVMREYAANFGQRA